MKPDSMDGGNLLVPPPIKGPSWNSRCSDSCTVVHIQRFREPFEKEVEIAAHDDMGRQAGNRVRLDSFHQVAAQSLKGKFALRKGR